MMSPWCNLIVSAVVVVGLAGCKQTTGPTATPAISVSADPSTLSIVQGGKDSLTATITRTGGFTGTVSVAVQGAPSGVTGTVTLGATAGTTTTAKVVIEAIPSTALGSYPITLRVQGTGVADVTAGLTLVVAPAPAYSLSLNPTALSIDQGASGTVQVTLARTNFGGPVNLAVDNLPTGVTATFNPAAVSGTASTLTLNVAQTAAAGVIPLTVRATTTASAAPTESSIGFAPLADRTAPLGLTVRAVSNVVIDFSGCSTADRAVWLAYQDGNGAWTGVTGVNDGYRFFVTGPKAGVAFVQTTATSSLVHISFYSQTELTAATIRPCTSPLPVSTLTGTFLHSEDNKAFAFFGGRTAFSPGDGPFQMAGVPSGVFDLLGFTEQNLGFISRRLDPGSGGSLGVVDFTGPNGFTALEADATVGNPAVGEGFTIFERYFTDPTPNACIPVPLNQVENSGPTFTIFGVPTIRQLSTDFHQVFVQGHTGAGEPTRSVAESFHDFASRVSSPFQLPPAAPTPAVTVPTGSTSYRRLTAVEAAVPAGYNGATVFLYSAAGPVEKSLSIVATAAWRGGSDVTLTTPDFTGVAGWLDSWAPSASVPVQWNLSVSGSTGGSCQEGSRQILSTAMGTK